MPSHSLLFENAARGSLGSKIFSLLRDRILNEEYARGEKLNELSLAKELNISRTPIREALKQLELEGLVESVPNKGVYVRGFSPRDIDDMFEIRKNLESLAVEVAIDRMDEIHLAKIKDIYELMEFYTGKKDAKKLGELNIMFHESIYQATQSAYFIQILTDMHYYVSMVSAHCIEQEERLESSLQEHHEILRCIEIGDKHGAIDTIHRHISKSQILVRNYYKTRNQKER